MADKNDTNLLRETLRLLIRNLGFLDKDEASCCGISLRQCHTIVEIARKGSISLNELAAILGLDKSTVSRVVDGLVEEGIVVRREDPDDRRYLLLSLSDKGREISEGIEQRTNEFFNRVLEALPAEQRDQSLTNLRYLLEAVKTTRCC